MKVALIGYGKMNRLVEALARDAGHEVACIMRGSETVDAEALNGCDVAIDFSVSEAVVKNVELCMNANVKLIEGTTGWLNQKSEIENIVSHYQGAMVYGANFSIGVNLFYRIIEQAAKILGKIDDYDVFLTEAHHRQKRDAPSGTALQLKKIVDEKMNANVEAVSLRAGFIPGTHTVGFDSVADTITLTHTARSREGFARGALRAAEWLTQRETRTGLIEFDEVVESLIGR